MSDNTACQPAYFTQLEGMQVEPRTLHIGGDAHQCHLQLRLMVPVRVGVHDIPLALHLVLRSSDWDNPQPWPPRHPMPEVEARGELDTATFPKVFLDKNQEEGREGALVYHLERLWVEPGRRVRGWLSHLDPDMPVSEAFSAEVPGVPRITDWQRSQCHYFQLIEDWLFRHQLNTVEGAVRFATEGPCGHFGLVKTYVLPRTDQADLQVDATLIDSLEDRYRDASTYLSLYGERHGMWVLQRRVVQAQTVVKKVDGETRQSTRYQTKNEALVAGSRQALIDLAGLGPAEKKLFKQAGLLPNATVWEALATDEVPGDSEHCDAGSVGSQKAQKRAVNHHLNLVDLDDRSTRAFTQIHSLAQKGKIDAADLDLLHKVARQLSRK